MILYVIKIFGVNLELEQIRDFEKAQSNNDINDFFNYSYSKVYSELLNVELESQISFLKNNYFKSHFEK